MEKSLYYKIAAALIVGIVIGFFIGTYVTINAVADIASRFIDRELVETAIYQYKNNIGACFPRLENASLYSLQGN